MYESTRDNIVSNYYNNNFTDCIEICKSFIEELNKHTDIDDTIKYNYWFAYQYLGKCYRRLNKADETIENIEKSMQYYVHESYLIENNWLLGIVYKDIGNVEKALYYYNICIGYYATNNIPRHLASMLKNKAMLLKDVELAKNSIELFKQTNAPAKTIDELYEFISECRDYDIQHAMSLAKHILELERFAKKYELDESDKRLNDNLALELESYCRQYNINYTKLFEKIG